MPDVKNSISIKDITDWITDIDPRDLSKNFLSRVRGFRIDTPGFIGKDFGTIHRYQSYPSGSTQVDGHNLRVSTDNSEHDIWIGYDSSNNLGIYVWNTSLTAWEELTRVLKTHLLGAPGVTDTTVTINTVTDYHGNSVTLGSGDILNYIAVNMNAARLGESLIIVNNTSSTISTVVYVGSAGANWQNGDEVWLFRMTGILPDSVLGTGRGYIFANGVTPHTRFMPLETQDKVTMFYGSSDDPPVLRQPIQIRKSIYTSNVASGGVNVYYYPDDLGGQRSIHLLQPYQYIGNDATINPGSPIFIGMTTPAAALTTTAGWYIDKAQLTPDFKAVGAATVPKRYLDPIETVTIGEGIKLSFDFTASTASTDLYHTRFYVTVLYRGISPTIPYQESDPICQVFLSMRDVSGATGIPTLKPTILIDPSRINKTIAGFRFYEAQKLDDDIGGKLANWLDDPTEYIELVDVLITDAGWVLYPTDFYCYHYRVIDLTKAFYDNALASANSNIDANLEHAIDLNRSYLTPRYGVMIGRSGGPVMAVDQDDQTIRLSTYSGDAAHMDDAFPDVSTDNLGSKQKITLFGHGQILGLSKLGTILVILRNSELERYDLQSGEQDIFAIDCYSKRSVIGLGTNDAPIGVAWGGKSGIWMLPAGGGLPVVFNRNLSNFYDGTLMISDGVTPFVTDTQRKNSIFGYDQVYREIYCHLQVNKEDGSGTEYLTLRYAIDSDKRKWNARQFNLSGVIKYFGYKNDGTMIIGSTNGILKYPNRVTYAAAHPYEDDVSWDGSVGTSANRGIPASFKLNVGEIHSLNPLVTMRNFIQWVIATSKTNGLVTVNFYADGAPLPFDYLYFRPADKQGMPRIVRRIGQLRQLEIEVIVPTSTDFLRYDVSEMQVEYNSDIVMGNR